eukprot:841844_1
MKMNDLHHYSTYVTTVDDDEHKHYSTYTYVSLLHCVKTLLANDPRGKRICALLDRRAGDEHKKEEIHYFVPPFASSNIPTNHVPEWYFNSTKQYLLPPIDVAKRWIDDKTMLFSFHVIAKDEIKVYLYHNGAMRFFGDDVLNVLPSFFDGKMNDNKLFRKNEKIKEIVKNLQFVDKKFETFRHFAKQKLTAKQQYTPSLRG